jgi:2-phosphosulfolactate phosphatase
MRIELHFTPHQTDELALRDRTIVVIDVLRASTSIITALGNGAKEIIPVPTVEAAVKISGNLFGDVTLLGGERNGKIIEGFHLGNSPFEYSEEKVKGKSIIFSSTNGSLAMTKARHAKEMAVCGFVNMSAVVDFIAQNPRDFVVLCAGNNGRFSLDDAVCAGMLLHRLFNGKPAGHEISDGAHAALMLYKAFGRSIPKMIRSSEHGMFLHQIGFGDDLKVCAGVDTVPVLPLLDGNVIRLKRDAEKKDGVLTPALS